ncbi:MAG: hypothetical protein NWE93_13245 [Candidatus Bathyarchaeota archaeon]|nr:hypothetical protein [Candidatus Bathyarchaeota archaeon]
MLGTKKSYVLLLLIALFAAIYRVVLVLDTGFPPGADIGLHNSLIYSITQGGGTDYMWNYYHMGGGTSNTFPGFHIFVSSIMFFTALPDYLAQALAAVLFSSLLVLVAFLMTRRVFNESAALIVAFLVGVSYYDIFMLLWSGYPNTVTLTLIPLVFYLLLEKNRFSRMPRLAVASLLSATIFLTHSLSAVLFMAIVSAVVLMGLCFPHQVGVGRKEVLEWLIPPFVGALVVLPFLVQAAPFYLNLNSPLYTGGSPDIQSLLLPMRLIPVQFVMPFFAISLLYPALLKYTQVNMRFTTLLFASWLIIPTVLTQSYLVGLYMDYERFLYFAALPLTILVGAGIFFGAQLLAKNSKQLLSAPMRLLQTRLACIQTRGISHPSNRALTAFFAAILILAAFFWLPHFSMTPPEGFRLQKGLQVMTQPGYEAMQWIKTNTPPDSVLVSDALYGWWLGGAQRKTVGGVEPIFLTNAREFVPAQLAIRLLDTDYLVDNGLLQIREDGGYLAACNPQFLVKLSNQYYPYPFLNFNNSQTVITYSVGGEVRMVKVSELTLKEMHLENSSNSAAICVTWENAFFNLTQKATVNQGMGFVNMTQTISSGDSAVDFISISFGVQTNSEIIVENNSYIGLKDPYVDAAGQLIFAVLYPTVAQASEGSFDMLFSLTGHYQEVSFSVAVFEYPQLDSASATQAGLLTLLANNSITCAEKTIDSPLDLFDYRQAILNLNASYIVLRDFSELERFISDPMFSLVFANQEVAIFQVQVDGVQVYLESCWSSIEQFIQFNQRKFLFLSFIRLRLCC